MLSCYLSLVLLTEAELDGGDHIGSQHEDGHSKKEKMKKVDTFSIC